MKILDKLMFWRNNDVVEKEKIKEERAERKRKEKEEKNKQEEKKIKYEKKTVELRENIKEDFENKVVETKSVTSNHTEDNDEEYNKVKTFNPKQEKKKEIKREKFNLFGLEIEDIIVGNKYKGEVVSRTNSEYIVFVLGSYNEVILPVSKTNGDINVGDEIELVVTHREEGNFIATQKNLEKFAEREQITEFISNNATVSGKVTAFNNNVFEVSLENGLKGYCYIKNMEYTFIENPNEYIGKEYTFDVNSGNPSRIDLSRREQSKQDMYDKVAKLNIGDVIEFEEYEISKNGLVIKLDGLRFFVPIREISHSYLKTSDDIESHIETNKMEIIDIKERNDADFSLVASLKRTLPEPIEILKEHYPVDSDIEVTVKGVKDYGVICTVLGHVNGLLHERNMSNDIATEFKNYKNGDVLHVKVMEYNEDNTLKLKS